MTDTLFQEIAFYGSLVSHLLSNENESPQRLAPRAFEMHGSPTTCPECSSTDIRFREKRNEWICEDCDHRWNVDAADRPVAVQVSKEKEKIKLFLSYGRKDTKGLADRLCVDLAAARGTMSGRIRGRLSLGRVGSMKSSMAYGAHSLSSG